MAGGQSWRLLTGQLVHWTARMTLVDLAMLTLFGIWVERRSRPLLAGTVVTAVVLVAAGLHRFAAEIAFYRGSSGLASALFVVAALILLGDSSLRWVWRSVGAVALLLLSAKTIWEIREGTALAAGPLPERVSVTPVAHFAGAVAGLAAFAVWRLVGRRPAPPS